MKFGACRSLCQILRLKFGICRLANSLQRLDKAEQLWTSDLVEQVQQRRVRISFCCECTLVENIATGGCCAQKVERFSSL